MTKMFQDLLALDKKVFRETMSDFEKFPFLFNVKEQIVLSALFAMAGELDD